MKLKVVIINNSFRHSELEDALNDGWEIHDVTASRGHEGFIVYVLKKVR